MKKSSLGRNFKTFLCFLFLNICSVYIDHYFYIIISSFSSSRNKLCCFINRFEVITFGDFGFMFRITISGLLSDGSCVCRRIADIRQIDRMFRNALRSMSSVRRGASSEGLRSSGRSAGKDQRMVNCRLRVPAFDLVLPFL